MPPKKKPKPKTRTTKADQPLSDRCPLVMLGASAGGLEAFKEFFEKMPPDCGMAFVLVQHLDPQHDTLIPELLSRHTRMPVLKAENAVNIQPNHVYVIAGHSFMNVQGCAFQADSPRPGDDRKVIDHCFRSAAIDQRDCVVGIILTGNGSDGTIGLRAIKEHGGLTVAQSPETAKFDMMPRNAIATGCVDFVLSIAEMPQRIIEYVRHLRSPHVRKGAASLQEEAAKFLPVILPILREKTGHDFSRYKRNTLIRRIQRRVQVAYMDSLPQYVDFLNSDPAEVEALFKDLLIGVTQFFRDPASFSVIEQSIIPAIFHGKRADDQVRVWVPGCASGEEAYSFAILLLEAAQKLDLKVKIQVFGTDMDAEALETSRRARYPLDIADEMTPERLQRFFKQVGSQYELADDVRKICIFSPHSLIKDPPFSRVDLLSCRNVLIYLEADLQKKLLPLFHYALNPNGYLFLGPSESLASRTELFRTIDSKHRIFQRRPSVLNSPAQVPMLDAGQVTRFQALNSPPAPSTRREQGLARAIERLILEEYAPASVIVNSQGDVVYFSGNTGKYLEPAAGVPNNKIVAMTRKSLRMEVRAALQRAVSTGQEIRRENIKVKLGRETQQIDLVVRPLPELGKDSELYIVLFRELAPSSSSGRALAQDDSNIEYPVIKELESELRTTREDLQTTIEELETSNEELKSANEELLSMNEELQSANEELQTSKEEVQSANEELSQKIEEIEAASAELRRAHEDRARLAAIVQYSEDAIIGKTLEGIVTSWNRGAERIFGYTAEEIIGQPITRIVPPERHEESNHILARLRRGERVEAYETERITKRGQRLIVSLTSSPIRDAQGSIIGAAKIARDITERRHAEEARLRLAAVVESSDDAIITKTLDGVITSWNKAAQLIYGYKPDEAIGQPVSILVPPGRENEERAILEHLRRGERVHHFETVRRRKDGTLVDISLTVSPIKDVTGHIAGVSHVARDITGRKQADEARFRLAAVVESSDDAIISKTLEGFITTWNNGAERIFGYTSAEVIGKHITILFPPERLPEEERVIAHIRRGERLEHFETVRKTKDGRLIDISLTVSPIKDPLGRIVGASKIARDITERKRAEEMLRHSAERLQLAFMAAGLGDWSWNSATDLVTLSDPAADIFGLPRHAPISWSRMRELLHPDDRERARVAVENALADRSIYAIEYRAIRPNGEEIWIAARGRGTYSNDGTPLGMIGVVQDITERQRTEEALRVNESRLRLFIEHAPAAIAMFDRQMRYQAASKRWLDDYHLPENVVGRPHYDLFPDTPKHWRDTCEKALHGQVSSAEEELFVCADGTGQWIKSEVRPWYESEHEIGGILIATEDVTARVQARQALLKSEEQLRTMANSIPQLAWMAEPDGSIFWFNERWYQYTGTTPEQVTGWGWQSIHDPEILPKVVDRWKESLRTGTLFDMEFPLRGADGVFRWFLTRVAPMRDASGKIVRWFGTNTDVDQVRRTREALKEETRILELLNETGKSIASQLDLQQLLQEVTDAGTKLSAAQFGAFFYNVVNEQGESYMLYTLSGAPREAFENFGLPRATPVFAPTFHGKGVVRSDDIVKDPRYGQMEPHRGMPKGHLPVRSYLAVPVISRSGEVIGGLFFGHPEPGVFKERHERLVTGIAAQAAVAIDNARLYRTAQQEIAERKRLTEDLETAREQLSHHAEELEQQVASRTASLRQALEQLEEFSYSVSHDLRAPLRAISGYNHILSQDYGPLLPPEAHLYIEKIARSSARMERLVNDVLTVSRIGRAEIKLHPIRLEEFILEIIEQHPSMQPQAADVMIDAPHTVVADDASLGQALSNLLSNAVKFVPQGTRPAVQVRSEIRGRLCSRLGGGPWDRNPPAPSQQTLRNVPTLDSEAAVRRYWNWFGYRTQGRRTHGWDCRHGTEHTHRKPLLDRIEKSRMSIQLSTFLLVEDNEDDAFFMQRAFKDAGLRNPLRIVTNGEDAIEYLSGRAFFSDRAKYPLPDMIFLDLKMPGLNGFDVLSWIRRESRSQVPVAILTSSPEEIDYKRARELGADCYLLKPPTAAMLRNCCERFNLSCC